MAGFIEDLYFGNLEAQEGIFNYTKEASKAYEKMTKTEDFLLKNLKGEQLEKFKSYIDSSSDFNGLCNAFSYKKGFRQGSRIICDIYSND